MGVESEPKQTLQATASDTKVEHNDDKTSQEIAEFEQKHSFELVYLLKKEVINEVKQLDLTVEQLHVLNDVEKQLDQEKEAYAQQKEVAQNVTTKSTNEREM